MPLDYNSPEALAPVIEALLFASDEPQSAQALRMLILDEELPKTEVTDEAETQEQSEDTQNAGDLAEAIADSAEVNENGEAIEVGSTKKPRQPRKKKQLIELTTIHEAVNILNGQLEATTRPYRIVEIAGGYQFATRSEYAEYVARLFKEKSRRRLSGASLETLAIVAYKQPVSKQDIELIRGVNCDEVLKSLLEKNLVTITGRAEAVGRPLLYGTTTEFLRHFGLHSISDLPKPREIEELMKEEAVKATTLEEATAEFVDPSVADGDGIALDEVVAEAKEAEGTSEEATDLNQAVGSIELDVDAMTSSGEPIELEAAGDDEDDDIVEDDDIEELDDEDFDEDAIEELDDEDFDEDAEEVLEDEEESKA